MKLTTVLWLVLLFSAGCAPAPDNANSDALATPSATLLPSYIATPQSAEANAQATTSAVEAMLESLVRPQSVVYNRSASNWARLLFKSLVWRKNRRGVSAKPGASPCDHPLWISQSSG